MNPLIKSNNLLNNALAMQEANRRGGEEGLMCNYRGELSECSQSNFFMVRDGVVLTPPSEAGLLEGITRAFLFEVGAIRGSRSREDSAATPRTSTTADEAFITSTTRELSPVVRHRRARRSAPASRGRSRCELLAAVPQDACRRADARRQRRSHGSR